MSVTRDLTDRLRRHYIKDKAMPGGTFVAECGLNNGFGSQRRCDALHVGFTSTSGRILRGHEVKVSRGDWLHELDQLDKASVWADQCHEWYLVTPTADIVHDGELPPGWGHLVPDPRAKVRFKTLVKADRKPAEHNPSWEAMRSVLARLDTLQRQATAAEQRDLDREVEARARLIADKTQQGQLSYDQQSRLKSLDDLEERIGLRISHWTYLDADQPQVSPADLLEALTILQQLEQVRSSATAVATALERSATNIRTALATHAQKTGSTS